MFWLMFHPSPPPTSFTIHLRAQPQKHYALWMDKRVITGMHIAAHSGQILKTRTVIRLIKEQHFNSVEFSKESFFPLTTVNLIIKNLKKIVSLFKKFSGHSSHSRGANAVIKGRQLGTGHDTGGPFLERRHILAHVSLSGSERSGFECHTVFSLQTGSVVFSWVRFYEVS